MNDIDELFQLGAGSNQQWRLRVHGEALELCEKVEARIEETGQRPHWRKMASRLKELGFPISDASVGDYYREKYPQLRRDK